MPQVIPFLASAAGAAGVISATTAAWLTIASSIAAGFYERDKARKEASRARSQYNSSLQDRLLTLRSGVSERRYVVGTVRTGGTLMYADTVGVNKTALDSVIALACNKCELLGYYFGDEYIAVNDFPGDHYGQQKEIDASENFVVDGPSGTVQLTVQPKDAASTKVTFRTLAGTGAPVKREAGFTLGPGKAVNYSGLPAPPPQCRLYVDYKINSSTRIRATFKDGSADQGPSSWPDHDTPLWTEDHLLKGVTHLRTLMLWDENLFAPGAPVIGAVLKGGWIEANGPLEHKFYDPRDGSYPAYTSNPAILAGWWMTLSRNQGGCGIPSEWIDWNAIIVAANICDELITVRTINGGGYEQIKRYECHSILSTGTPPLENLQIILSAMNGRRAFTSGKYRIIAGAFRSASVTITDNDIIGTKPLGTSPADGKEEPPNIVTARFANATKNWQETDPKAVVNDAYVASDGHEAPIDISLPATTDPRQANYLQGVALETSRPKFSVTLTVGGIGEDIALYDTVQLNLANRPAYAGKTFEVLQIIDYWNGEFELTLSEIRPQMWALDGDRFTPTSPVPKPDLSYLWNPAPITGFVVSAGTPQTLPDGNSVSQLDLTWNAVTQPYVRDGGRIDIRYREPGGGWIDAGSVPADAVSSMISASLIDLSIYQFQVSVINAIGARSRWTDYWLNVAGTPLGPGVQGPGIFTWAGPVGVSTTSSSITKTGASGAFNAGAYSLQSYSVGCFVTARPGEATTDKVIGLNNDPDVDANFTGINFAWRASAGGNLEVYESGILISAHGTYTTATINSVTYDGVNVRYLKDGTAVRTVAASGLRLFLDTSLFTNGASWQDVTFGPMGGAGPAGPAGPAAQAVRLSASTYVFTFDGAGAAAPAGQSITFTASRQNIPAAVTWTTTPPGIPLAGSGDTRTLSIADFGANQSVRVTTTASGFSDAITINRLTAGANGESAVVAFLTNENHTLAADQDGTVASYASASGLMFVFEGTVDRTALATVSVQATENCTAQINTAANTPIAGQPKGFYRVTAVTADQAKATFRAVFGPSTRDVTFTVTRARQGAPGDGANLLRVDEWLVGTTGMQGTHWIPNGPAADSAIVLGGAGSAPLGPFGITEPLWEARADGDPSGPDGGWDYPDIPIDHLKTYRSTCWFRFNQASGNLYHGCGYTAETFDLGGGANGNPYFMGATLANLNGSYGMEANQWYLSVGLIHGSGYAGGNSGISGIYDPRTGKQIVGSTEFRMAPGATTQKHRAYHFYDPSAATRQWMARPRFEEVNGNEPSIWDLMGLRLPTPWIERGNCFASLNSFHKLLNGSSAWNSDIISIQSFTNCHLQVRPGQTTGYFMVGLNTDPYANQSYDTIDFAWYCNSGGALAIYENGTYIGDFGTYTTGTELAITYDGSEIVYYKDRVVQRRALVSGARFYVDSSFYNPGASCIVKFGPGTSFETIGTGELEFGAATDTYEASLGSVTKGPSSGAGLSEQVIGVIVPRYSFAYVAVVTITFRSWANVADIGFFHVGFRNSGVKTGLGWSVTRILRTTAPGDRVTLRALIPVTASDAASYDREYVLWWQTTSSGITANIADAHCQVEIVKR